MKHLDIALVLRSLVALLLASILPQAAISFAADRSVASLQHYVDAGRLSSEVKNRLERDGQTELLVVFEENDVQAVAGRMRESARTVNDSAGILQEMVRLYDRKKHRVLADIPTQDLVVHKDYPHFPVVYARVNEKALARLLGSPDVAIVAENKAVLPTLAQSLPLIGAPLAQSAGATGSGTAVAILDTGLNYTLGAFGYCTAPGVPASTCKVAYAKDFATNDASLDDTGHGTNVAGIVIGVAPDAKLLGLDVFARDGYAYYSDILEALDWVLANKDTYNIVAVNMSLGGGKYTAPCTTDPLATAVGNLKSAGVVTAIASGNETYTNAMSAPACVPGALSVGAVYDSNMGSVSWSVCSDYTTAADKVPCFSNSASFMTMLAPGAVIDAAGITMSGTSQATPHVAAAVAVLKGRYPWLTVDNILTRFTSTGLAVTDSRNGIVKPRLALYNALRFPSIVGEPLDYDFGTGSLYSTSPAKIFTLTNTGMADLAIGTITIDPSAGTSGYEFIVQNDSCSGYSLAPAATCTFGITMIPQTIGAKGASLVVSSADPFTPLLNFSLSGTAQGGAACANLPVRIAGSTPVYFSDIQSAYDNAADGAVIQLQNVALAGDLMLGRDVHVAMNGGYNCEYTDDASYTLYGGKLVVRSGTVAIGKLRVM